MKFLFLKVPPFMNTKLSGIRAQAAQDASRNTAKRNFLMEDPGQVECRTRTARCSALVAENGRTGRAAPNPFGNWHAIYMPITVEPVSPTRRNLPGVGLAP